MNALGNLELVGAYVEALSKLGHKLETVAHQVLVQLVFTFSLEYTWSTYMSILNKLVTLYFNLVD